MEENTNLASEQTTDLTDAFLDGWNNEPTADASADLLNESTVETNDGEQETEQTTDAAPDLAGKQTEAPNTAATETEKQNAPGQDAAGKTWKFAYMQQEQNISRDDERIPAMLSKAMDYDRVRAKYDEAKPVMELFNQFAKQANMSVADYVRFVRTEAKKAGGMDETEAKRLVELEDREATVAAQEAARQEAAQAAEARQESVRRDIETFRQTFPDVAARYATDLTAIPDTVWAEVNRGVPLTVAYTRFALEQAKATVQQEQKRAETAQKNNTNAARSTGSLQSAGNAAKNTDPFLEGWDSAG